MDLAKSEGGKAVVMDYTPITDAQKAAARECKEFAAAYFNKIVECEQTFGRHRDFSLAKTKVQEASMWLTRGLTNPEGPPASS
jgi:hypothetical protein